MDRLLFWLRVLFWMGVLHGLVGLVMAGYIVAALVKWMWG